MKTQALNVSLTVELCRCLKRDLVEYDATAHPD
jgi:hypothetical protein